MRDPMNWSVSLGRWFGVTVRVHLLFFFVALAVVLRVGFRDDSPEGVWLDACLLLAVLFVSVLLHEYGHCAGARAADGEASEILIWPLGGLATLEVPPTPRAHLLTTAAGPAVNLALCLAAGTALAALSIVPSLNPLQNPYQPELRNWQDGKLYGYKYNPKLYQREVTLGGRTVLVRVPAEEVFDVENAGFLRWRKDPNAKLAATPLARLTGGQYALWLVFWINWGLLLLNLLPAFPLDGGRMLQSLLWWRTGDQRVATQTAVSAGYFAALAVGLIGVWQNETMVFALALFIYISCMQQSFQLQFGVEESQFGYDFSQGYTSLERGETETRTAPPPRPNFVQRWRQRRADRKAQRQREQREQDERRLDELLDKVHREGRSSLTDEEQRFLARVSRQKKNR